MAEFAEILIVSGCLASQNGMERVMKLVSVHGASVHNLLHHGFRTSRGSFKSLSRDQYARPAEMGGKCINPDPVLLKNMEG